MDILIVDDEQSIRDSVRLALESDDHWVMVAEDENAALSLLRDDRFDVIFIDLKLGAADGLELLKKSLELNPRQLAVIFTAYASVRSAVSAMQAGAFDYLEKPFSPDKLRGILMKAKKALRDQAKIEQLEESVGELKQQVQKHSAPHWFKSEDEAMKKIYELAFRAAQSTATILILGESGTGKSVLAKAIHENSHLSDKPFVTVSCPSLSRELLESELFGHVKGSFTGATKDKWGKIYQADGGTLFLDEIGELPLDIQPKLLRLLQEREYERLGENKTRKANVRVITATNQDLLENVKEGTFREDLYFRINVIALTMPSLRDRPKDLEHFAQSYLNHFSEQYGRKFEGYAGDAIEKIKSHSWPGNLRELKNTVERASILSTEKLISRHDLACENQAVMRVDSSNEELVRVGKQISLEELEAEHIKRVVDETHSLQEAAEVLGIDSATLYRKRKKLKLT